MATKPKAPAAAPPSTAALDTAFGTCRDVDEFEKLNRIGEGTYGTVYRARDKVSGEIVALKRVILHNEKQDGENCVQLKDVVVGRKRSGVFLVFEYCEHDLSALLSNVHRPFTESEVKRVLMELLRAVEYLHAINIIHRDLKLSNILYDGFGRVKLADFGLARETGFPSPTSMTPKVVTLWYRAPELLLGAESYSSSIDIWACGCIFAELILNRPLLNGSTDLEQLQLIYKVSYLVFVLPQRMSSLPHANKLDLFDASLYVYNHIPKLFETHLSAAGLELLQGMLTYDPSKRITVHPIALRHPYFDERPFPKEVGMMPTFPSQHDDMPPPPPPPPTTSVQREDHHFGRAFGGGHQVVVGNKKRKMV
ncbi:hypothetical protein DYB38_005785 [Aphanomyces astaci]|uniref:Cyclin-dependent kinase 2 homolog n=1 Tax=Aphanomyces astaci TaxID=112090 RepID=A0A397DU15_APHAT|nr:hypothetical protein DYB38_005785 [Aphanomyces astaci]